MSRVRSSLRFLGPVLIVVSLVLVVLGNRWGSYLVTPVAGLYLSDALFSLGAAAGIIKAPQLRVLPPIIWILFGLVWLYSALLVLEIEFLPEDQRYAALRDAAPFLFLSLVPLVALSLTSVSVRLLIQIWRLLSLACLALGITNYVGLLSPTPSALIGSDFVLLFANRPDLQGAALGVGIVAWGSWPAAQLQSRLPMQAVLLGSSLYILTNRSAWLALLTAAVIAVFREFRTTRNALVPIGAMAVVVGAFSLHIFAGSAASPTAGPTASPTAGPTASPTAGPTAGPTVIPEIGAAPIERWITENVIRLGTTNARWETWSLIADGMTQDRTWLLGGSSGSDYLFELCTGIEVAPAFVIEGPKCPVDSHGLQPVVRDPHNFAINVLVYHGVVGLIVLLIPTGTLIWRSRRMESAAMPIAGLGIYLVVGLTFIISAGYALIPIAFFLGWLLRNIVLDAERKVPS